MGLWFLIPLIVLLVPTVLSIVALFIASRAREQQPSSPLLSTLERNEQRLASVERELRALKDRLTPSDATAASPSDPARQFPVIESEPPPIEGDGL